MRILLLLVCLTTTVLLNGQQKTIWPSNKKGAVVLTYDDALVSQLSNAIPQLDHYRLNATFFLTGGLTIDDMNQWKIASKNGHELGNHTLYHPCSEKIYKAHPHFMLDNYDAFSVIREIAMMNKVLYGIDGNRIRTFAYPCCEFIIQNRDYTDTLRSTALVKYARIGGNEESIITDFKTLDLLKIPAWGVTNNPSGQQLIDFVKRTIEKGGLGIIMFHGIGGDYITVSNEAHQELLAYLSNHKKEIWTDTFQHVIDHVASKLQ